MASFAKIGLNNKVIEVLSVHNNELLDSNGVEQEVNGIDFLTKLTGWSIWVQTSYNGTFRKRYATAGFKYLDAEDIFIASQPFESWTLVDDYTTTTGLEWEAPIPKPIEDGEWIWDEGRSNWTLLYE